MPLDRQSFRGIPFELGAAGQANAILLDGNDVTIGVDDKLATYIIFAHIVEDRALSLTDDLRDFQGPPHTEASTPGNDLGDLSAAVSAALQPTARSEDCADSAALRCSASPR